MSAQAEELWRREQVKTFTRMGAPWFNGKRTAIDAEVWLRHARKIMDTMGVTEDGDRVRLASFHCRPWKCSGLKKAKNKERDEK